MKNMQSTLAALGLGVCLLLGFGPAHSATVDIVSCYFNTNLDCAQGVTNLDVDGSFYDVTFVGGDFTDIYPDETASPFWGQESFADAFSTALGSAVSGVTFTSFVDLIDSTNSTESKLITGDGNLFQYSGFEVNVDGSVTSSDSISGFGGLYVEFTPAAAVPVPAAAWLFGSALGFLGWMRRKKA